MVSPGLNELSQLLSSIHIEKSFSECKIVTSLCARSKDFKYLCSFCEQGQYQMQVHMYMSLKSFSTPTSMQYWRTMHAQEYWLTPMCDPESRDQNPHTYLGVQPATCRDRCYRGTAWRHHSPVELSHQHLAGKSQQGRVNLWCHAKMWYLQCNSNGDTTDLHITIVMI